MRSFHHQLLAILVLGSLSAAAPLEVAAAEASDLERLKAGDSSVCPRLESVKEQLSADASKMNEFDELSALLEDKCGVQASRTMPLGSQEPDSEDQSAKLGARMERIAAGLQGFSGEIQDPEPVFAGPSELLVSRMTSTASLRKPKDNVKTAAKATLLSLVAVNAAGSAYFHSYRRMGGWWKQHPTLDASAHFLAGMAGAYLIEDYAPCGDACKAVAAVAGTLVLATLKEATDKHFHAKDPSLYAAGALAEVVLNLTLGKGGDKKPGASHVSVDPRKGGGIVSFSVPF